MFTLGNIRRTRLQGLIDPSLVLGERIVNGTFDANVNNWSSDSPASIAYNGGTCRISRNSAAIDVKQCYQNIPVILGKYYSFIFDYVYESTSAVNCRVWTQFDGGAETSILYPTATANNIPAVFQATGSILTIIFRAVDQTTHTVGIDNVRLQMLL